MIGEVLLERLELNRSDAIGEGPGCPSPFFLYIQGVYKLMPKDLANRAHKNQMRPDAAAVLSNNNSIAKEGLGINPKEGSKKPVKLSPYKGKGK